LLGISGPQQDAIKVKEQIRTFLLSELKLTLSEEKTLITHAKTEKARFLGYDIHVLHEDTKHDKRGQRCINGVIGFRVPDEKMKDKARQFKKGGKPIHQTERLVNSDFDIIAQYQSEFRGFAQYYLLAYNAHQLHGLKRTMELSLARTLANKFKTTVNKIFKMYKTTRERDGQSYKVRLIVSWFIVMLTILPRPCSSMSGVNPRATRKYPVRFVSNKFLNPSGVTWKNGCGSIINRGFTVLIPILALFTKTFSLPQVFRTHSTESAIDVSERTSIGNTCAFRPTALSLLASHLIFLGVSCIALVQSIGDENFV
jgi:hypothetical protein